MEQLYPLKFTPIIKDMIWGGSKLKNVLHKKGATEKSGESWEISDVNNNSSVVANGFLKGNTLNELIEIYMGDLVGDNVYDHFGIQFPLLIKFIDANDKLSIQVHPDDIMAFEEHESYGKTEMWYVMQAEAGAELIIGFNKEMDQNEYLKHFNNNTLPEILNFQKANQGDVFFIPAGQIHAIGTGLLIAEIQQSSDITYRIFDWNRTDVKGNPRQLHTDLALKAMNFKLNKDIKTTYTIKTNSETEVISCKYFTTNILEFDVELEKDYNDIDSFVVYICVEGKFTVLSSNNAPVEIKAGETVLIPAELKNFNLQPSGKAKLLEVYIKESMTDEHFSSEA
jgi:mannose-6-phosphate isomerase